MPLLRLARYLYGEPSKDADLEALMRVLVGGCSASGGDPGISVQRVWDPNRPIRRCGDPDARNP